MYSNLQPLVTMAAAWALLSETPRWTQLAGGLCIICGLLLTRLPGRQVIVAHE
jgi:drug/metabolite transporter (DMT)-like permease